MPKPDEELTRLVNEVFLLADALSRAGEAIVSPFGLTAPRWLILGAIKHEPKSAAGIARARGLRRQSVQEQVVRLEKGGFVTREPDPNDARAPLVVLTDKGRRVLDDIEPRRAQWAGEVADGIPVEDLLTAVDVARRLRSSVERTHGDPAARLSSPPSTSRPE